MATSFKTINPEDIISTRTLLHEAIPITGTIIGHNTGAYAEANVKNFSHGMFQSVYDYPYLSSSANHIIDFTVGYSNSSILSSSNNVQNSKKINIYNEMAQILAGFNQNGVVRRFDQDGDLTGGTKVDECFFLNFTRLLTKDEIKKGSFSLELGVDEDYDTPFIERLKITDASGSSGFKVNSPAGEYGLLFAEDTLGTPLETSPPMDAIPIGLLYYQAGIACISGGVFMQHDSYNGWLANATNNSVMSPTDDTTNFSGMLTGSSISASCNNIRHRIYNVSFNNTTELNSTIYFCRANHNDFNYSSNPTYLSGSKIVTKINATDEPVSYVCGVGLYSADNELLAIAKLSEPVKKGELTLRVRLDY